MRVRGDGEPDHQIHPVVSQEATGFFFVLRGYVSLYNKGYS